MRVLIACEFSGIVRNAFIARGHDAWSCDLLPSEGRAANHHVGDVREGPLRGWVDGIDVFTGKSGRFFRKWDLMIAHPTCTRMTNSAVQWLNRGRNKERMAQMLADVELYRDLWRAPIPRVCIENPVMHTSTRKPRLPTRWGRSPNGSLCNRGISVSRCSSALDICCAAFPA
jgi:hypothetical protein